LTEAVTAFPRHRTVTGEVHFVTTTHNTVLNNNNKHNNL